MESKRGRPSFTALAEMFLSRIPRQRVMLLEMPVMSTDLEGLQRAGQRGEKEGTQDRLR